jgi:hypothetical protein
MKNFFLKKKKPFQRRRTPFFKKRKGLSLSWEFFFRFLENLFSFSYCSLDLIMFRPNKTLFSLQISFRKNCRKKVFFPQQHTYQLTQRINTDKGIQNGIKKISSNFTSEFVRSSFYFPIELYRVIHLGGRCN